MNIELLEKFGLSPSDLSFLETNGISKENVLKQIKLLNKDKSNIFAISPATIGNSFIKKISLEELKKYIIKFEENLENKVFINTIPAAGAATRQFQLLKTICYNKNFKDFYNLNDILKINEELLANSSKEEASLFIEVKKDCLNFWNGIKNKKFAFIKDLEVVLRKNNLNLLELIEKSDVKTIMLYILEDYGLNYGNLPKALLKFHSYNEFDSRLALEEHLRLTVKLNSKSKKIKIHFILSEEHLNLFNKELEEIFKSEKFINFCKKENVEISNIEIKTSFQEKYTDTIAINLKNKKISRTENNDILLRKGGHGALLENIHSIDADGIWLQNIDNILFDNNNISSLSVIYKKIMCGMALILNEKREAICTKLKNQNLNYQDLIEIINEIKKEFQLHIEFLNEKISDLVSDLLTLMDRPIVIAGYVALKPGQKGGGPFVIEENLKNLKYRKVNTVEGAEFNLEQLNGIFLDAKFFNPVNFFILKKDSKGTPFNLLNACQDSRSFVTIKSDIKGNPIKALERPGLWNGSLMNTLQINIPIPENLFSAVKTLSGQESLLSPLHQENSFTPFTETDLENGVINEEVAEFIENKIRKDNLS